MVVARLYAVEDGAVDLGAEGLARALGHVDGQLEAAAAHVDGQVGLVDQEAVFDDVPGGATGHGNDLVTREEPGPGGGRPGVDCHHGGQRHGVPV